MSNRTFKVMGPCVTVQGAELRFRGQWLKAAGFHPGMRVTLSMPSPGIMELRVSDAAQLTAKDFIAAIEPLKALGL